MKNRAEKKRKKEKKEAGDGSPLQSGPFIVYKFNWTVFPDGQCFRWKVFKITPGAKVMRNMRGNIERMYKGDGEELILFGMLIL